MVKKLEIYKCEPCKIIAEVLTDGQGDLICCDKPMEKLVAKTADEGKEKHVPVTEEVGNGIKIKVGSVPHPMEEKHYIQWIEVIACDNTYRQFLKPGQAPEASFNINTKRITVREHCNVHGLWQC